MDTSFITEQQVLDYHKSLDTANHRKQGGQVPGLRQLFKDI